MQSKDKMLIAAGATVFALVSAGYYYYKSAPATTEETASKQETTTVVEDVVEENNANALWFRDPFFSENHSLAKTTAFARSSVVSDVDYRLTLAMVKGGETFQGLVRINFNLKEKSAYDFIEGEDKKDNQGVAPLFIDYKGKLVKSLKVNGKTIAPSAKNVFVHHRIYVPIEFQEIGANVIEVQFESEYVNDCAGVHYFKDDADGAEYIYSELEPANAHIWFPCFDQPDLKAAYDMLVLAPVDWTVVSTCSNKPITNPNDASEEGKKAHKSALERFGIVDEATQSLITSFGKTDYHAFEFEKSPPISTYIYSLVCGPFEILHPSEEQKDPTIPMRLFCRKSLLKYVELIKEDWFRITKNGIHYYEKMFNTPYPFGKFDQVFCPDYNMGAMENVGCVLYRDEYVQRDEKYTRTRWENIYNTILHEISHMWFGNLVTMKWWDDLWLNESFANMISFMCMDEAEGLEDIQLAWSIFLDEQLWGLKTDQKDTSHPIACQCTTTADADDIFDGISYGKGASWLRQLVFYFGKDTLKEGLKTYFAKYAFKNTELKDFITELAQSPSCQKLCQEEGQDMVKWSDQWLKHAGCAELSLEASYSDDNTSIKSVSVIQELWNVEKTPENRLRTQKFQIGLYDEDMKVYQVLLAKTSDTESKVEVAVPANTKKPFAYMINYEAKGYGKFIFDEQTLQAFEAKLDKIEDRLTRKQIYNTLFDMISSGRVSGARVFKLILARIGGETAEEVLVDVFRYIVPSIINKYMPLEEYEKCSTQMFKLSLEFLNAPRFEEQSTKEMFLSAAIGFAQDDSSR